MQCVCNWSCAAVHADNLRVKREKLEALKNRREIKLKLDEIKPMIKLFNDAQYAFNAYIRARDKADNCISCGRWHDGQWHAGHYRSVGAAGHLRYNEDNVHKQCAACNKNLSGNIINYTPRLINKIGIERYDALINNNDVHHWTREDLIEIKHVYKSKLKSMML